MPDVGEFQQWWPDDKPNESVAPNGDGPLAR